MDFVVKTCFLNSINPFVLFLLDIAALGILKEDGRRSTIKFAFPEEYLCGLVLLKNRVVSLVFHIKANIDCLVFYPFGLGKIFG